MLVEAVVAAALLLATCVAISSVLSGALKADRSADHRDRLEQVLTSECQRLAALPYFASNAGAGRPPGAAAPDSLVAEVFPWARTALNTDDAYFVDASADAEAGTFVTTFEADGVSVQRRAAFVADERDESRRVGAAVLAGWDCTTATRPPATSLAIRIVAIAGGRSASRVLVLTALRPSVEPSASTPAAVG